MSNQINQTIAASKVVMAAPGKIPDKVGVELGGTLEFRNNFPDFPDFEIKFDAAAPPGPNKLTGTIDDPIFVHMPDTSKDFNFHIVYKRKPGRSIHEGPILARTCPGCSQDPTP